MRLRTKRSNTSTTTATRTAANVLHVVTDTDEDNNNATTTNDDPLRYANRKVRKFFQGHGWFSGKVHEIWGDEEHVFFRVVYEDGDDEDLSPQALRSVLLLDKERNSSGIGRNEEEHQRQLVSSDEEEPTTTTATTARRRTNKRRCLPNLWHIVKLIHKDPCVINTIRETLPYEFFQDLSCAEKVAHFFLYLQERQNIWTRQNNHENVSNHNNSRRGRNQHQPGPEPYYTESEALQKYFFCNNYRELDLGTTYFRAEMLRLWEANQEDITMMEQERRQQQTTWVELVLWASVCYRLCNCIRTFEDFGKIPLVSDWQNFRETIRAKTLQGVTIFTQAHIVVGFKRYIETLDLLSTDGNILLRKVSREIVECCRRPDGSNNQGGHSGLEGCFWAVKQIPNVNDFFAWQITCDLLESQCLGPCTENDWVHLGPGAKEGIDVIFGKGVGESRGLELARFLQSIQVTAFNSFGKGFPYLINEPITLKNVEHSLCEFSKYCKVDAMIRIGQVPVGQRLAPSRSMLDDNRECFFVKACGNHSDVQSCNKCRNGYCAACADGQGWQCGFWVCRRCIIFDSLSFDYQCDRI